MPTNSNILRALQTVKNMPQMRRLQYGGYPMGGSRYPIVSRLANMRYGGVPLAQEGGFREERFIDGDYSTVDQFRNVSPIYGGESAYKVGGDPEFRRGADTSIYEKLTRLTDVLKGMPEEEFNNLPTEVQRDYWLQGVDIVNNRSKSLRKNAQVLSETKIGSTATKIDEKNERVANLSENPNYSPKDPEFIKIYREAYQDALNRGEPEVSIPYRGKTYRYAIPENQKRKIITTGPAQDLLNRRYGGYGVPRYKNSGSVVDPGDISRLIAQRQYYNGGQNFNPNIPNNLHQLTPYGVGDELNSGYNPGYQTNNYPVVNPTPNAEEVLANSGFLDEDVLGREGISSKGYEIPANIGVRDGKAYNMLMDQALAKIDDPYAETRAKWENLDKNGRGKVFNLSSKDPWEYTRLENGEWGTRRKGSNGGWKRINNLSDEARQKANNTLDNTFLEGTLRESKTRSGNNRTTGNKITNISNNNYDNNAEIARKNGEYDYIKNDKMSKEDVDNVVDILKANGVKFRSNDRNYVNAMVNDYLNNPRNFLGINSNAYQERVPSNLKSPYNLKIGDPAPRNKDGSINFNKLKLTSGRTNLWKGDYTIDDNGIITGYYPATRGLFKFRTHPQDRSKKNTKSSTQKKQHGGYISSGDYFGDSFVGTPGSPFTITESKKTIKRGYFDD